MAKPAAPKARATNAGAQSTAGNKAAAKVKADASVDMNAEEEEAAAAAATAAAAAAAEREQKTQNLASRMGDTLRAMQDADKSNALEIRLGWVAIGDLLVEGRSLFMKEGSNNPDDTAFGRWIAENGFTALGNRNSRASAIWISEVYNKNRGLYDLFPTESTNGEPLRRSPRTLQTWVRDQIVQVFQDAWESDSDNIGIAADAEDKESKASVAKAAMPNVYAALTDQLELAAEARDKAREAVEKAKSSAERKKASDEFLSLSEVYDAILLRKEVFDHHSDDERLTYFASWRPKRPAVSFKDCDTATAAARLFALLSTHPQFGDVYSALGDLVQELADKVAADAGDVDADPDADDADPDADFDVEDDAEEIDDVSEEDFGDDDAEDFGDDDADAE